MKKRLWLALSGALWLINLPSSCFADARPAGVSIERGDQVLASAFQNQQSNLQVEGQGKVIKLLADDNNGSRHQKFIVRLHSGQTLLIAHNIDLAEKITALHVGDDIVFYGEYEWSAKGGTVHWTHHDPNGRHVAGWLRHSDRIYQ